MLNFLYWCFMKKIYTSLLLASHISSSTCFAHSPIADNMECRKYTYQIMKFNREYQNVKSKPFPVRVLKQRILDGKISNMIKGLTYKAYDPRNDDNFKAACIVLINNLYNLKK